MDLMPFCARPARSLRNAPSPVNHSLEVENELADGRNNVILQQIPNGLAVLRAALLLVNQAAVETAG